MAGKSTVATKKIMRYSVMFAGYVVSMYYIISVCMLTTLLSLRFFGSYHGLRKALNLYNPQPPEWNVITAAACTITPLIFIRRFRPLIPYSIMLVGLDAFNGMNDI